MEAIGYQLRHTGSDRPFGDEGRPVVFASADDASAFAARFACELDAFVVERCEPAAVAAA